MALRTVTMHEEPNGPRPHMWVWRRTVESSGGLVRFFLKEDFQPSAVDEGMLRAHFSQTLGVFGIRLYPTYVVVQWEMADAAAFREVSDTVIHLGLQLFSQYFNWQGELVVGEVQSLGELEILRRLENCPDRWYLSVY